MLTGKQFEAIGRLTLAFNDIEFIIETYTLFLIGAPEYAVSEWLAEQGMFQQKADRLEGVLNAIASERPVLDSTIKDIVAQIKQARDLAKQRNGYVHAMVVDDFERNFSQLRRRGQVFQCDEEQILFLADQASRLSFDLGNACGELDETLQQLRTS